VMSGYMLQSYFLGQIYREVLKVWQSYDDESDKSSLMNFQIIFRRCVQSAATMSDKNFVKHLSQNELSSDCISIMNVSVYDADEKHFICDTFFNFHSKSVASGSSSVL
jgi:hypothetical protein